MQNTPDCGSCMVWVGESEYMRISTLVVSINMGQVLLVTFFAIFHLIIHLVSSIPFERIKLE